MNLRNLFFISSGLLFTGCLSGNNFPDKYAEGYCNSLFSCVKNGERYFFPNWSDPNLLDLLLDPDDFDSKEECVTEVAKSIRSTNDFDAFQEGDLGFSSDNGSVCLNEVEQVVQDSDCDGEMGIGEFLEDGLHSSCEDAYGNQD